MANWGVCRRGRGKKGPLGGEFPPHITFCEEIRISKSANPTNVSASRQ